MNRHQNHGIRKLCDCARRNWPKCAHSWYFNFKPRGGSAYQFSLDAEMGDHIASKEAAKTEADRIRGEIRAGTFVRAAERRKVALTPPAPSADAITLDAFAKVYVERAAQASGKKTWKNDEHMLAQLRAFALTDGSRLGAKMIGAITEDDLEAFFGQLRAAGRAASTRNQYVQVLKASFRWAVKKGYLTRSPISEDSALKRTKIAQRSRRLAPDVLDNAGKLAAPGEERRLLAAAGPRLQRIIIGALETGCRRGELLSLQWRDVDRARGEIRIRAEKAKDAEDRVLPISTRLAGVLEMAKTDPAGKEYGADAYVFGELGEQVENVKRAWETAVLKAHGHEPAWQGSGLAPASRAALAAIDLHFHDLRHEAGSRWLEAGWALHEIRDMLGHASIEQTDTYLNAGRMGLQASMRRLDPARCDSVVSAPPTEHPTPHNADTENGQQVTVN
ncbi:MAG TPA: tyrosine-type recombinase/integrase [Vicinamibacterales bacterium]|jgi:integrase|nr:tyrosine-type recombinase/integrase [Vicinamibacterales bacterium]